MSSGAYDEADVYRQVEAENRDIIAIVNEGVDPLEAFQRGSNERPLSPEKAPIVLHMNSDIIKGYFPDSVDPETAYRAADAYLAEDAVFHFKKDEENWARSVNILLDGKREEVTEANGNNFSFRHTEPEYGRVSPSEDDCSGSFDASTGWPFS
jgi:hypothetical protein